MFNPSLSEATKKKTEFFPGRCNCEHRTDSGGKLRALVSTTYSLREESAALNLISS